MTHYRWKMIAIAFVAMIIVYLDRSALSYAITPLKIRFGLTDADFGFIASGFGVGYMLMTVTGGVLVDRFGARKVWSIASVAWSIACAGLALATGFAWLFIFRILLGMAEGPSFPAFSRVSTDWLSASERARSLAFGLAAVPFASVIGAPLVSHLIYAFGWQWMFVILGSLGVLWAILWYAVFRDHPQEIKSISSDELLRIQTKTATDITTQKTTWRFLLLNRALLVNNYAFFVFGYLLFFAITWLPGYLEQVYQMKIRETGWFLVLPWITATILLVIGGFISDRIWRNTQSIRLSRSHVIWVCQVLSAICFIPVVLFKSLPIAVIGISLGVGFGMMPNAAFYALNADLARDRVGTSLGIMDCGFALAGIVSPMMTGWLASLTGNFNAAFILLIVLTFTSAFAIILFQHPDK